MTSFLPGAAPCASSPASNGAKISARTKSMLIIEPPGALQQLLQPQSQQINGILAQHLALVVLGNFGAARHGPGHLSRLRGIPMGRVGREHQTVTAQILNGPFAQTDRKSTRLNSS